MSDWQTLSLQDAGVTLIDCDHRTPPATSSGFPYVAIPQLVDGRIRLDEARLISARDFSEWTRKANPLPNDVILMRNKRRAAPSVSPPPRGGGRREAAALGALSRRCNPGETAHVAPEMQFALGQNLVLLRSSGARVEREYLRWIVRSREWWEQVNRFRNVGAIFDSLKCADIPKFRVPVPPVDEQKRISQVLSALDEKIELNRRMSQTLEVIAQAIFKSWFVDFEPVRAKASGESHESIAQRLGLAPAHLDLFQDLLVETDNGLAPEGWRPVTLKDLTTKIGSGATPRGGREVYVDEGVALIRSQNVYDSEFVWPGLARLTDEAAAQLANVTVQPSDVLLNITGASILRTCVVPDAVLPARVNQHVAIIRARAGVSARYLHLHLLRPETKALLLGLNAGASREAVTKAHLESVRLLNPGTALMQRFDATVGALYAQVANNAAQSQALGQTRDALLPRLLSGALSPQHIAHAADVFEAVT